MMMRRAIEDMGITKEIIKGASTQNDSWAVFGRLCEAYFEKLIEGIDARVGEYSKGDL